MTVGIIVVGHGVTEISDKPLFPMYDKQHMWKAKYITANKNVLFSRRERK